MHTQQQRFALLLMSESKSFLDEWIRLMVRKPVKCRRALVGGLGGLSLALVAVAAQVEPPNAGGQHHEMALDDSALDRYTGYYKLAESMIFTITREGGQLAAQLTGQPAEPTPTGYRIKSAP
jgi:bla regulator protein BlaR1